jgi:hypothetical protein
MSDASKSEAERRRERLAAALRDNLRRRKAQSRELKARESGAAPAETADGQGSRRED